MRIAAIAAATTLVAASAFAGPFGHDDCEYTAARRVVAPLAGVSKVVIHAESGSLKVDGVEGAGQVVAAGTACTSESGFLDRMTLTSRRQGSELHISADIPEKSVVFGFFSARLDFAVTMPAGMPVVIDDDSGSITVTNTGATKIDDDSGSIEVRKVRGGLIINDDSGSIDIDDVVGNVLIEDDSGEITAKNIQGSIEIEDDSGSITVARVSGSLRVREDGSGAIVVQNVRGDVTVDDDGSGGVNVTDIGGRFTVGSKGSGAIEYARVAGKVSVPERHRRDRD
jgi:hypothetical protein